MHVHGFSGQTLCSVVWAFAVSSQAFLEGVSPIFGSLNLLLVFVGYGDLGPEKAHKHVAHKQFLGHPGHRSSRPGTPILPAGYPDENVYVPWVPHTAHKLLTPGHRSGDPWSPGRETPPPPGQSPENFVYVYVPFPFLRNWLGFFTYG